LVDHVVSHAPEQIGGHDHVDHPRSQPFWLVGKFQTGRLWQPTTQDSFPNKLGRFGNQQLFVQTGRLWILGAS
jgi:hypothetical protein